MRIALLATCLGDAMFPDVSRATVVVLERLGHTVVFPAGQTCCGQMHVNSGYLDEAIPLVRHHVETFEAALATCDAVVAPSGSCVGSVRHQHAMVARSAGDDDLGSYFPHRVTYHPTCHSLRMLHVGDKPLQLLRAVEGLDLVELPAADTCCGFGGTFAVKNPDVSTAM